MKDILVIGESCLDIFVYCEAYRLCPDIPVPALNIISQTVNDGMAKNVKNNIDSFIQCDLLTNPNWKEITKTRYMHDKSNHMFLRVDSPHNISRINWNNIDLDYKIIVVADYNKGFLHEDDIKSLCNKHKNVFIDTKKNLGNWIENAKFIKINNHEFNNSLEYISSNNIKNKIIHTKGGEGCEYNNKIYPVNSLEIKDVSGAGDSFMAAMVVNYLKTENIEESIIFANKCASEVVKHRGVSIIKNEI